MKIRSDTLAPDEAAAATADGAAAHVRPPPHVKWYYFQHITNSVLMQCTLGGALFGLYMTELGLNAARIGSLVALFPFMQALSVVSGLVVERIGFRRAFLLFYSGRKLAVLALAGAPWVLDTFGPAATFRFIAVCVILFGLLRSLGETSLFPWMKAFVPDACRGRVQGVAMMGGSGTALFGLLAVAGLTHAATEWGWPPERPFQAAFVCFPLLALLGVAGTSRLPGGARPAAPKSACDFFRGLRHSLKDRRFLVFLAGEGAVMGCLFLFVGLMPVYMKTVVGIPNAQIVLLGATQMVGAALAGRFAGQAADRAGGGRTLFRLLLGLAAMPGVWLLLPALGPARVPAAYLVYLAAGFGLIGANIAVLRLLMNGIVKEARKTEYLSVRYAFAGLVAGTFPLLAGWSTEWFARLERVDILFVNAFLPAFALCSLAWLFGAILFRRLGQGAETA